MKEKKVRKARIRTGFVLSLVIIGLTAVTAINFLISRAQELPPFSPKLGPPRIYDFSMVQTGESAILKFKFSGVAGGIERARFKVSFILERRICLNEICAETFFISETMENLLMGSEFTKYVTHPEKNDITHGYIKAPLPLFDDEALLLSEGEAVEITFFISLTDLLGRESNMAEFVFVLKKNYKI